MEHIYFNSTERIIQIQIDMLEQDRKYHAGCRFNGYVYAIFYTKIAENKLSVNVTVYLDTLANPEIDRLDKQLHPYEYALKSTLGEIETLSSKITTVEIMQQLIASEDTTLLTHIYTMNTLKAKIFELKTTQHPHTITHDCQIYKHILSAGDAISVSDLRYQLRGFTPSSVCVSSPVASTYKKQMVAIYSHEKCKFVARSPVGTMLHDKENSIIVGHGDGVYKIKEIDTGNTYDMQFSDLI